MFAQAENIIENHNKMRLIMSIQLVLKAVLRKKYIILREPQTFSSENVTARKASHVRRFNKKLILVLGGVSVVLPRVPYRGF